MAETTPRIAELRDHVGQSVTVRGWVTHLRWSSGKARKATGWNPAATQAVRQDAPSAEVWDRFKELSLETSVHLTGEVRAEPRAPGGFEMGVVSVSR